MTQKHRTNRRTYMKTLGVLGATSLGSTGLVTAQGNGGGKEGLDDIAVDVVLNYSIADSSDDQPNSIDHYGYPFTLGASPEEGGVGGFYFARTDPPASSENPSFFDISNIELTPNGSTLHHSLQFFAGFLITDDSKPKPYTLVHSGDGRYISRGQVMNFETKTTGQLISDMSEKLGVPPDQLPNIVPDFTPFTIITDENRQLSWRAACTDRIQLKTDDGKPTTTPEWGLTRADFYSRGKGRPEFKISLLYTIWNPNITPNSTGAPSWTAIPPEIYNNTDDSGVIVDELISPGRLNLGGQ